MSPDTPNLGISPPVRHGRGRWLMATALCVSLFASGCGLIIFTGAAATSVVAMSGYAVYEGGKVVVSGTERVASDIGDAARSGKRKVGEVVFDGNELETVAPYRSTQVYSAARIALRELRFKNVEAEGDGLAGVVTALTADNEKITVKIEAMTTKETFVSIRYGTKGDFNKAEILYSNMLKLLEKDSGEPTT